MQGAAVVLGWEEIYCGFDAERYYKTKSALEKAGIRFKTKVKEINGNRMARNSLAGADPLIVNRAGMNQSCSTEYQIFVKKADISKAQGAL